MKAWREPQVHKSPVNRVTQLASVRLRQGATVTLALGIAYFQRHQDPGAAWTRIRFNLAGVLVTFLWL